MKALKSKIALIFIVGLALIQLSLVVMMHEESQQNFCSFNEQCIFKSVFVVSQAVSPLMLAIIPFVFVFALRFQFNERQIISLPISFLLRRTLKGIVQRE